ncbi:MAG: NAD(P)-binding domain-containing protein [Alphaproteobacteria bacterium]|nr:NAD(P)-binding domain-containing protein [Alphaproteobacteria bacterium]MBL7098978.1 NAD(P)-binding domain-containing protein [Alphaproteobacteria bacterium]
MQNIVDVAIVGAGPYGLSLAAHLAAADISFRIFGKPMSTWRDHMPKGMQLKSEGFASNLSAPDRNSTLEAWCAANGRPYSAQRIPVECADFVAYADWFTRTYVPTLEPHNVTNIVRKPHGYTLTLDDGRFALARRVVMAVGITWFKNMPDTLAALPRDRVSHSFDHHDCSRFKGRHVTVLGAGASAIDTAIALAEAGARVQVVARRKVIPFHIAPDNEEPSLFQQIQKPHTGIGPGWRSFFCTQMPLLFHKLPQSTRLEITRRHLGPAPGWFTREKFEGKIPACLGEHLKRADMVDGRVALEIENDNGRSRIVMTDHVVAATGYKVDLRRLPFLDAALCGEIDHVENTPILNDNFEASVPGVYFLGLSAANSFGPLLRFMYGSEFAAPRLATHLRRRVADVVKKAA